MNAYSVLDLGAGLNGDDVAQTDAQIVSDDAIHADLFIRTLIVGQNDADSFLATLSFEQHRVAAEELQFVHLRLREGNHRVVIVDRLVHQKSVWSVLLAQDRCRQILSAVNDEIEG